MAVSADHAHDGWKVGDRVFIRQQRWCIAAIDDDPGGRTLTLSGIGPHNAQEQRQLLESFEVIERTGDATHANDGDESPARWASGQRRWRRAWREMLLDDGPWTALRAADAAHFTVMPHQLEPALAIVSGQTSRVLLADAVGLGKTVQAGLLLAELLRRGAAQCALILTPAGLRDQWRRELEDRFHVSADVLDLRTALQRAADLPIGVHPWTTPRVVIASLDYIKRAEVLPDVRSRAWDLVIVDEAHLVSPGSDRLAAVSQICGLAAWVVLLTATPHSGDRDAYLALRALGSRDDDCLCFRRTRADVQLPAALHVHHLDVRPSRSEARMHAALDRYAEAIRAEQGDAAHASLLLSVLRKRALSSPVSLARSVARRLSHLGLVDPLDDDDRQLSLPLDDGGGEFDASDEAPDPEAPALRDLTRERHLLAHIARLAALAAEHETKLGALARLLRRLAERREPALVFTEYRDTLVHLQQRVAPAALLLHGGLARPERNAVVAAFTNDTALVLLATDAAGEGLNLQARCRCVIHLEVPWNPVRLEQRNGRVDRIGQRRTVHAFHLVSRHPTERQLLERMRQRAAVAAADIDTMATSTTARTAEGDSTAAWRRAAANDEVRRIERARRLATRSAAGHARDRAVICRPRPRLRRQLRGKALGFVQRVLRDDCGHQVASRVEGCWLTGDVVRNRRVRVSWPIGAATSDWAEGERGRRDRFWQAVRRRAAYIAEATVPGAVDLFQPGLFDRRSDHQRQARRDEQEALADVTQRRRARLDALHAPHVPLSVSTRRWLLIAQRPVRAAGGRS